MNEANEGNKTQKTVMKNITRVLVIPIFIIIIIMIIIMGSIYYIFRKDLKEFSKAQLEYYNSLEITPEGIQYNENKEEKEEQDTTSAMQSVEFAENRGYRVASIEQSSIQKIVANMQTYKVADNKANKMNLPTDDKNAKSKAEKIASQITCLQTYVKDTLDSTKEQKLAYLMNAEVVTKFPYIESIADDDSKLNGTIRFYRHINPIEEEPFDKQEYYLTYIKEEAFEDLMKQYESSGNRGVYKYFTIDEDKNVVVAYGRKMTRTITTDDAEVTLDVINEQSSENYVKNNDGTYTAVKYTISKKPIEYMSLVEPYVLPFNLLATLLVQTRDYNLVKEIADLAYDSEIRIAIYDNESISDSSQVYTYNKAIKYTENTKLNLENVNVNPKINDEGSNIWNYIHNYVKYICYGGLDRATLDSEGTTARHSSASPQNLADRDGKLYKTFVKSMDTNGIITATDENNPYTFTTTYHTHSVTNSAPTIGVELADIWAGKWTATYKEENKETPSGGSDDPFNDPFTMAPISNNRFKSTLFNKDGGEIGNHLYYSHTENMINNAVEKIVQHMEEMGEFSVNAEDFWLDVILEHCPHCDTCNSYLKLHFARRDWKDPFQVGRQKLLDEVKTSIQLQKVREHIIPIAQQRANYNAANSKQEFEQDLRKKIENNYEQYPTAHEANVSIKRETTSITKSSSYKKDTTQMENEGKALKKILSRDRYEKDREAILVRSEWFWEAIQMNEDTAKIENLLRYLFNIAFNTNQFGTFTEEEIANLFKAFEPRELKSQLSGGHRAVFMEWLKHFENDALRQYINGTGGYTYADVAEYVTEDKQFGKCYYTSFDGCWNFTYGIMVCNSDGDLNNEGVFEEYGYNLTSIIQDAKSGKEVLIPMSDLDKIYEDIIEYRFNLVKENIEKQQYNGESITMEIWQYYALTNVAYQYGNCGQYLSGANNIAQIYAENYLKDKDNPTPDEFRNNAVCETASGLVHFFTSKYTERQELNWILFNEGRYVLKDGSELFASAAGSVAEFATQFVGCVASQVRKEEDPPGGLFQYKSTDGKQFWKDEWCAMFVSYCFDKCGLIDSIGGTFFACRDKGDIEAAVGSGYYRDNQYIPQAGDIIFFTYSAGEVNHTGIVYSCDGTEVTYIDGNSGGISANDESLVLKNKISVGDSNIYGYQVPK